MQNFLIFAINILITIIIKMHKITIIIIYFFLHNYHDDLPLIYTVYATLGISFKSPVLCTLCNVNGKTD